VPGGARAETVSRETVWKFQISPKPELRESAKGGVEGLFRQFGLLLTALEAPSS
jgi:hypothetical protein